MIFGILPVAPGLVVFGVHVAVLLDFEHEVNATTATRSIRASFIVFCFITFRFKGYCIKGE